MVALQDVAARLKEELGLLEEGVIVLRRRKSAGGVGLEDDVSFLEGIAVGCVGGEVGGSGTVLSMLVSLGN